MNLDLWLDGLINHKCIEIQINDKNKYVIYK